MFWKKKRSKVGFERVQRGFLSDRKGKVIPCREAEDGLAREPTVKSLIGEIWRLRVLEAERRVREGV